MPEAPNGVAVIGCDAAAGAYFQLYSDDRGVRTAASSAPTST
jgi:hypothetical protein